MANIVYYEDIQLVDGVKGFFGTGSDMEIFHNGSQAYIENYTGELNFTQHVNNGYMRFKCDDGSGGTTSYMVVDGNNERVNFHKNARFDDGKKLQFGGSGDLNILHDGSAGKIENDTGHLIIRNNATDSDIAFQLEDNGSTQVEYMKCDSSLGRTTFSKETVHLDTIKANFGTGYDLKIYHNATDSIIENETGNLYIVNDANDKDIIFQGDDGSGGLATYMTIDGGAEYISIAKNTVHPDSVYTYWGDANDFYIGHTSTSTVMLNSTGHLEIANYADDKDIFFRCDDGSGGIETYFFLDGSIGKTKFPDSKQLVFGDSSDLRIVHDGSDSLINSDGTGHLYIQQFNDDKDIYFRNDDGSGGVATYFYLDGSTVTTVASKQFKFEDDVKLFFGTGADSALYASSDNLIIEQTTNDKDIKFKCDDGQGGTTEYFILDGSAASYGNYVVTLFPDNSRIMLGTGWDVQMWHDGTKSRFYNGNGDLEFEQAANGMDMKFYCDDGSGGSAQYFRLDGGSVQTQFLKSTLHYDNVKANFGDGSDLEIYHDGSNSYIVDSGTGDLLTYYSNDFKVIQYGSSEVSIWARTNDYVKLFHNGIEKLATTSTGVTVSGTRSIFAVDTVVNSYSGTAAVEVYANGGDSVLMVHQDDGNHESKLHFRTGGNDTQLIVPDSTYALKITTETTSNALLLALDGYLTLASGIAATNTSFSGTMNIAGGIYHIGDTDTFFGFIGGANTWSVSTGGSTRLDINDAGVRFGDAGARIVTVKDEDDMAANSNVALATQQSIKAYVDNKVTGVLTYQGTWNASTNSPTLSSGSGTPGYYYIVSHAGSTDLDGITDWAVGDWAVFSDQATDAWQKIDNTAVGNVSGSGGANYVTKWTGSGTIANSSIIDQSGTVTFSGNIVMGNNDITGVNKIAFDDGIELFGATNNNYLKFKSLNANNGGILFQDGDSTVQGYVYYDGGATSAIGFLSGAGEWAVRCIENDAVELRYDNSIKFQTASAGVNITGNADVSSNVLVGGADSYFGENVLRFKSAGAAYIDHNTTGQSIVFRTSDSSSLDTTALTLSSTGNATFEGSITIGGSSINKTSGDLTLDVAGDITLDADGGDVFLKDAGSTFGTLQHSGFDFIIKAATNDKDIKFNGFDNGSGITALRLDMSDAGWAHFNAGIAALGDITIEGASTPKLTITDTTNNLLGRIRVGNSAMYIDADAGEGVAGTSLQLQVDAVTKLQITESSSRFQGSNVTIRRDDTTPVLYFDRNDASIIAGNDLGQIQFRGADPSGWNEGARIYVEADGTWDTNVYPTRIKFDVTATNSLQTALKLESDMDAIFGADIYGKSANNDHSKLYQFGGLFLTWDSDSYGTNLHHSITSTDNGTYSDSITINSFDKVRINIDSNDNDAGSTFSVGCHTTGTSGSDLFSLDQSGNGTFLNNLTVGHDLKMPTNGEIDWNSGDVKLIGTANDITLQGGSLSITEDGSNAATLTESGSGDFTIHAQDDIRLNSGGQDIVLQGDSVEFGRLSNSSGDFIIKNITADKDIILQADDGSGSTEVYFYCDGSGGRNVSNKNFRIIDSKDLSLGSSDDLKLYHDGTDSYIQNATGHLKIVNYADDKRIEFQNDDGSGGVETYFYCDGAGGGSQPFTVWPDEAVIAMGTNHDTYIQHTGAHFKIDNYTGNLEINQQTNDGDILFKCDNGTGGVTTYLSLDGGLGYTISYKDIRFTDSAQVYVGTGNDCRFFHNGTDTYLENFTGELRIMSDDWALRSLSAPIISYDTSDDYVTFSKMARWEDSQAIQLGNSGDLKIYHDGSNSYIDETGTGSLYIKSAGAIRLQSDTGENMIYAVNDGAVNIYHNNVKKLETTASGISVTGDIADRDIPCLFNSNFSDNLASSIYVVPFNNNTEATVSSKTYYHYITMPYAGKLTKIVMKNVSGSPSSSFTTQLFLYVNGSQQASSSELTMSSSKIEWSPTSSNTFSAGDELSFAYQKSASSKTWSGVSFGVAIELTDYDI